MSSTVTKLAVAACLALVLAQNLAAETVTVYIVNSLGEASDSNPGDGFCATSGGVCTLRAAIEEGNAQAEPNGASFSVTGTVTPATPYPPITGEFWILGIDAPGWSGVPLVKINGGGTIARGFDFVAGSDDSRVEGVQIYGFTDTAVSISSARVLVSLDYLGPIGGGTPNGDGLHLQATSTAAHISENVISGNSRNGIRIEGSDHVVEQNLIGTDVAGETAIPNGGDGVVILNATGVHLPTSQPNVISGNGGNGITVDASSGNVVAGIVGLKFSVTAVLPNGGDGIAFVNGSNDNAVGYDDSLTMIAGNAGNGISIDASCSGTSIRFSSIGSNNLFDGEPLEGNGIHGISDSGTNTVIGSAFDGNRIIGNALDGIHLGPTANGTTILGNDIGRSIGSTSRPNGRYGIGIDAAHNVTIGGTAPGEPNDIKDNISAGIAVSGAAAGVSIVANSIEQNGALGIDLGADGVTANDTLDADSGPNSLQNFPLITSAVLTATQTVVQGTINSTPNSSLTLHFYSSDIADPSGFGEGATYLGSTNVTTNASGNAAFNFAGAQAGTPTPITATATGANGTSEFSAAVLLASAPSIQFSSATYSSSESAVTATITVTRTGDLTATSTVNYAITDGTATQPADYSAANGMLTFAPGVASQTFTIGIVNDALVEPNETINLTLTTPAAATLGAQSSATLTIVDDDGIANLSITKTPSRPTFTSGQHVTFTIAVTNNGPDGASNVIVTDALPAGMIFVSATSATFTCGGTSTITCTAAALANGATATIDVVVTVNSATTITNSASVTADQADPASTNNAANAALAPAATIPTLSEYALLALALVLGAVAAMKVR